MQTISRERCIEATINGVFKISYLRLTQPLTYSDMLVLANYFKKTPLTAIDISLELTAENIIGLRYLSSIITQNNQLTSLEFTITKTPFHLAPQDNVIIKIMNYLSNRKIQKMDHLVYNALINMVSNKPLLKQLIVNLELVETTASKKQSYQFARHIQHTPLEYLNLNFKVDKKSQLPIFDKDEPNSDLAELKLQGLTFGKDVIDYLLPLQNLQILEIDNMLLDARKFILLEKLFKANPLLSLIAIKNTNMGQINSQRLLSALRFCSNVTSLDLSGNNLSRFNSDTLCKFLFLYAHQLADLDLSKNAYMSNEAISIAQNLTPHKTLQRINMSNNFIEDEGVQAFVQLLKNNPQITAINLSHNTRNCLSDDTINMLCAFLRDPECQLKELHFVQKIRLDQLTRLCNAILENTTLTSIDLNFLTESIQGVMFKMLVQEHIDGLTPIIEESSDLFLEKEEGLLPYKQQQPHQVSQVNSDDSFFSHPVHISQPELCSVKNQLQ